MFRSKYKYIYLGMFFAFLITASVFFFLTLTTNPLEKPELRISKPLDNTVIRITDQTEIEFQQEFDLCKKHYLNCENLPLEIADNEQNQLINLTLEEIKNIYLTDQWRVVYNQEKLIIIKKNAGLCPCHQSIKHLGPNSNEDFVAIYFGPQIVGVEAGIFEVTEIALKNLPLDYQAKIKNHEIEFYQQDEMIAVLDSLSEYLR